MTQHKSEEMLEEYKCAKGLKGERIYNANQ